jgi:hypothetical protein
MERAADRRAAECPAFGRVVPGPVRPARRQRQPGDRRPEPDPASGNSDSGQDRNPDPASGNADSGQDPDAASGNADSGQDPDAASGNADSGQDPDPASGNADSGQDPDAASGNADSGQDPDAASGNADSGQDPDPASGNADSQTYGYAESRHRNMLGQPPRRQPVGHRLRRNHHRLQHRNSGHQDLEGHLDVVR